MPGYDRTGPTGTGARTGWGRGGCAQPASVEDSYQRSDVRRGYRPWADGRGHRFRGGRRSRGRGFERQAGAIEDPALPDDTSKTFLMQRMEALMVQLDSLKKLLSKHEPADGQDRE